MARSWAGMIRSGSVAADVIDIEGVIETINASDGTRIDGTRVALKGKPLDRMIEASCQLDGRNKSDIQFHRDI